MDLHPRQYQLKTEQTLIVFSNEQIKSSLARIPNSSQDCGDLFCVLEFSKVLNLYFPLVITQV